MLNTHILSGIEHSSHRITTNFRAKKHERSGLAANQQRFIVKLGRMNREHEKRLSIQVRQECAVTVDSWTGLTRKGLSLVLASPTENCQSTPFCLLFLSIYQAVDSRLSSLIVEILLSRHPLVKAESSISAMSNQDPCLGV